MSDRQAHCDQLAWRLTTRDRVYYADLSFIEIRRRIATRELIPVHDDAGVRLFLNPDAIVTVSTDA
jgi:hypothetical protein